MHVHLLTYAFGTTCYQHLSFYHFGKQNLAHILAYAAVCWSQGTCSSNEGVCLGSSYDWCLCMRAATLAVLQPLPDEPGLKYFGHFALVR